MFLVIAIHYGGKPSMAFQAGHSLTNGAAADATPETCIAAIGMDGVPIGPNIIAAAECPWERGLPPKKTPEAP
ncbi:MAG: hypothetical protein ACLFRG_18040 [Desulfococcaceae bacterium]